MNRESELSFTARDGFQLAATLWRPDGDPRATVLIASATAVPRGYYGKFAAYLAERGLAALTFDYRGIGGSRPPSLRSFPARMRDWAGLDLTAAVDHAAEMHPGLPLLYVGHSFGGQALGLLRNNARVSRALFVAAQLGYWRLFPFPENYRVFALMRLIAPPVVRAFGYAPGRLGIGVDLPRDVFLEWAGWCMKPRYMFDDSTLEGLANFPLYRGPLRGIGLDDDKWAPPIAVAGLLAYYRGTDPRHLTIRPRDVGADKIGHFGFFRAEYRHTLWRPAVDWLADDQARSGA
jgi:predicted alpha/beta hydrolase